MLITDPNILEYLHDATVSTIVYDCKDTSSRSIEILVTCAPDAGFTMWNGKRLRIRLESVVLLSFYAFGAIVGREEIDSWTTNVTESLEVELQRLRSAGVDCEGEVFMVAFQSGSLMQGVCKRITAEEMPSRA